MTDTEMDKLRQAITSPNLLLLRALWSYEERRVYGYNVIHKDDGSPSGKRKVCSGSVEDVERIAREEGKTNAFVSPREYR